MKKHLDRRDFLKHSLGTILSVSPLMTMLGSLNDLQAGQNESEYKALVCILLEGGCDAFNMIVPTQPDSYRAYQKVRKNLALTQSSLLPFTHTNKYENNPLTYGMRGNMIQMHQLFEDKKLSLIANVGTLTEYVTLEDIKNGIPLPPQLFAHNTQRGLWMRGDARGLQKSGWGGRMSDIFYPSENPYFNITTGGNNILQQGGMARSISFDNAVISPNTMRYYGFGPKSGGAKLGNVYQSLYEYKQKEHHKLMAAFAQKRLFALNQQVALRDLFQDVAQFSGFSDGIHESGKPLGRQLELIAQLLSVRENFPTKPKRQIFFVNHHGWDTHDSDNTHQVQYLSDSLGTFYRALKQMGLENQVTTFTISDFGRSLSPNGAGTDHGWGNYAFVMGGAVKGGDIYGKMPQISKASPDAWEDRMIPTTASEEYLATLVKWFGANKRELDKIFPNLHSFKKEGLEFMF